MKKKPTKNISSIDAAVVKAIGELRVYRQLANKFGTSKIADNRYVGREPSQKAVSLFLLRAGIDGIEYPAGCLLGAKSNAKNYVVFDENAITIEPSEVTDQNFSGLRPSDDNAPELTPGAVRGISGNMTKKLGKADITTAKPEMAEGGNDVLLFVWRANKEGGQSIGNREIIRKPTFDDFVKDILPKTTQGYYKGKTDKAKYQDFLRRNPNTRISYVDRGDGFKISEVKDKDEFFWDRIEKEEKGWAKNVESFESSEAQSFRKVEDSDSPSHSLTALTQKSRKNC